jgi:hypothetical protein
MPPLHTHTHTHKQKMCSKGGFKKNENFSNHRQRNSCRNWAHFDRDHVTDWNQYTVQRKLVS